MSPTVWFEPGIMITYCSSLDAERHSHHAIQLVWPVSHSVCQLENSELSGVLLINSNITHQLQMEKGWILLVEPESDFGQLLVNRLDDEPVVLIAKKLKMAIKEVCAQDDPVVFLQTLMSALEIELSYLKNLSKITALSDKRIRGLIQNLNNCLPSKCLKPAKWRASEVADQLAISEGRFLHLFREQMGIAWRPYLLWRRLGCAVGAMTKGMSATESAHLAGFSDSAHLSRTFRRFFGLSIRMSQNLFSNAE